MSDAPQTYLMTVEVDRITFQRPGNEWVCVKAHLDDIQPSEAEYEALPSWLKQAKQIAITGYFSPVQVGDLLDVEGVPDRNPKYGWQLKARRAAVCARHDERALYSFLRKLPYVGPKRASQIVSHFGGADEVFQVLDQEPTRLAEITGITSERAQEIATTYANLHGMRDAWVFCRELALQPRLTARIMDKLGMDARPIITEDPFLLMTKINASFRDCDSIRKALGIADDDPRRVAAAMLLVLRAALRGGDCWVINAQLFGAGVEWPVEQARDSVGLPEDLLRTGLDVLSQPTRVTDLIIEPPRVIIQQERIYLTEIYEAEQSVCKSIAAMLAA